METAKVDIRKLQLLNDRIAQVAEALNQVRLSVHGLSYAAGTAQPGVLGAGAIPQGIPGLSHTSGAGVVPPAFGFVPQIQMPTPIGVAPFGASPYAGLSHSSEGLDPFGRAALADPYLAQRVAQTFPYAWAPAPLAQGSIF